MATTNSDTYVGCGIQTLKKDRRVVSESFNVKTLWKQIMLNELGISNAASELTLKTNQFVCRNCFNSYSRHVKSYTTLKSKLSISVQSLSIHIKEIFPNSHPQKRTCSTPDHTKSCTKQLKLVLPHVINEGDGASSTTIVCNLKYTIKFICQVFNNRFPSLIRIKQGTIF